MRGGRETPAQASPQSSQPPACVFLGDGCSCDGLPARNWMGSRNATLPLCSRHVRAARYRDCVNKQHIAIVPGMHCDLSPFLPLRSFQTTLLTQKSQMSELSESYKTSMRCTSYKTSIMCPDVEPQQGCEHAARCWRTTWMLLAVFDAGQLRRGGGGRDTATGGKGTGAERHRRERACADSPPVAPLVLRDCSCCAFIQTVYAIHTCGRERRCPQRLGLLSCTLRPAYFKFLSTATLLPLPLQSDPDASLRSDPRPSAG